MHCAIAPLLQAYPFVVRKVLRNERGTAPLLRQMLYDPSTGGFVGWQSVHTCRWVGGCAW